MRRIIFVLLLVALLAALLGWLLTDWGQADRSPIRVGVLHSLSGTMAISESSVVDATLLAIEQINADGGLLGRTIEVVVADGRSDWSHFAVGARRLITQERVQVVFGCWTSASRKTVRPVFEELDHLLFYPVQYEGLEQSPNIVYTGAAPNQQIIPAVRWSFDNLGDRFFVVASDYVFPRAASEIIRDQVKALRGEVVGEDYVPLGGTDFDAIAARIVEARPDVVLNTVNGDSNVAFFAALRRAGVTPQDIPVISFSVAEDELRSMDAAQMVGDYAAWNYFQSIDTEENRAFVEAFRQRYGADRVTDDPVEAAWFGVRLWAQTVRELGTADVRAVRAGIRGQTLRAPQGIVSIDPTNLHTWKAARIGRIRADGQFDVVWTSARPGLILLDLNMPRMDGREALSEIKADPSLRQIPVVILTTSRAQEDIVRTYDLGAAGFVVKPVAFEGLVDAVRAVGKYWIQVVARPDQEA